MRRKVRITPLEMMVYTSSKELKDGERVFIGQGYPLIPAVFAKKFYAPNLRLIMEGGVYDFEPYRTNWHVADLTGAKGAICCCEFATVFAEWLYEGYIDTGFLGAAQVDKYGNINSTVVGDYFNPILRMTGSGGAHEIGAFAKKTIILKPHGKFVEKLDYFTTPGYLDGYESRYEAGLPEGTGPTAVITKQGVFRFDKVTKELYLDSIYPWVSIEEIKKEVPWDLIAEDVKTAKLPSDEELRFLRGFAPLTTFRRDYHWALKLGGKHWMLEPSDQPLITRLVIIDDKKREAMKKRIAQRRESKDSFFRESMERWQSKS